jgi:hypothetical protein
LNAQLFTLTRCPLPFHFLLWRRGAASATLRLAFCALTFFYGLAAMGNAAAYAHRCPQDRKVTMNPLDKPLAV